MIEDEYCSYKVAELLKEKGFKNEYCDDMLLAEDGGVIYKHATFRNRDDAFYATMRYKKQIPYATHQIALRWLREEKNIHIVITATQYGYEFSLQVPRQDGITGNEEGCFDTYEEAVEAALKYCLTNLI